MQFNNLHSPNQTGRSFREHNMYNFTHLIKPGDHITHSRKHCKIIDELGLPRESVDILHCFMKYQYLRTSDIIDMTGLSRYKARKTLSYLDRLHLVTSHRTPKPYFQLNRASFLVDIREAQLEKAKWLEIFFKQDKDSRIRFRTRIAIRKSY